MKPNFAVVIAVSLAATTRVSASGLHGELALASDYSYRGLRWTEKSPAYQAYLEYGWESGFYLGAWASSVDLDYYGNHEWLLSYYGGYTRRLNRIWALDVTVFHHQFQDGSGTDPHYDEVLATWHRDHRWSLTTGYSRNYLDIYQDSMILELTFRQPLPWELVTDLNIGRQLIDAPLADSFSYAEVGLSRALGPWALRYSIAASDCRSGTPLCREHDRIQHMIRLSWAFSP